MNDKTNQRPDLLAKYGEELPISAAPLPMLEFRRSATERVAIRYSALTKVLLLERSELRLVTADLQVSVQGMNLDKLFEPLCHHRVEFLAIEKPEKGRNERPVVMGITAIEGRLFDA